MSTKIEKALERIIFASRWLQAPLYVGLIIAGVVYAYKFVIELIHLITHASALSEVLIMLSVLTLIDITMVANLLIVVIVGGYATFVSKLELKENKDRPDWLEKMTAGTIKIKLATALIGVSAIHLLKSFINIENMDPVHIQWQVIIHAVFLGSALILAYTEKILHQNTN
jgi:uncharacterized protein (TIGR00645 family)